VLHTRTYFVLLFLLPASFTGNAQEICNNGKDDDGDGLADLKDPDCQCQFSVAGNMLINASFEAHNHCPVTYVYDNDYKVVDYWQYGTYTNINETNFYHSSTCEYDNSVQQIHMPPAQPLPDGNAYIAIFKNAYSDLEKPEKEMTKSYVGQCLQAPLKKGEDYTLSFYAGRFKSWDDSVGKLFPFTVAVFGNARCDAVPFGREYVYGNGCPTNYEGWVLLGEVTITSYNQWVQSKVKLSIPFDINVIEVGSDCSILPPIHDQADSTTYLDYHIYYLDDLHLLPTKDFPFHYIHTVTETICSDFPLLKAPVMPNAHYQWYKDSIAISGATDSLLQVSDTAAFSYYNVSVISDTACSISEPFLVTASNLHHIKIPADTVVCDKSAVTLAPAFAGITYTVNDVSATTVTVANGGVYNIIATDAFGCSKTFRSTVTQQNCDDCSARIPNAFTPNGDGLNDIFKPKPACIFSGFKLSIFNRWGQKIYESSDPHKGWNGTYNNKKMPLGTYVYALSFNSAEGKARTIKGAVFLMK